jgi:serine/threonine protein kinase
MSAIVLSEMTSSLDVVVPSNSCATPTTLLPFKSASTFEGNCPDELLQFVRVFSTHTEAEQHLMDHFFPDTKFFDETTLFIREDATEMFVSHVYTFGDSPYVIKEIVDQSSDQENAKLRWFPELVNHLIAQSLMPDHVLTMHAACMNASRTHLYFVYERARVWSSCKEIIDRADDMFDIVLRLNALGLVHLDTKPSNFLIRESTGAICIHDLALALPLEHIACPGSLMFSDSFLADKDLWDAVKSPGWGPNPFQTIREWGVMCQVRLLYAGFPTNTPTRHNIDRDLIGLNREFLYTSPLWFKQMFTVLNSFSSYSLMRVWKEFVSKVISS